MNRPRRRRRRRSGFITALAITMIALIAVALAGLTARVSTLARQSAAERERAQTEELVLAGIEAVRADPSPRVLQVPAGAGSLKITAHDGRTAVEATAGRTRIVQELDTAGGAVKLRPQPTE
jgi:uncharacterized membrane protein